MNFFGNIGRKLKNRFSTPLFIQPNDTNLRVKLVAIAKNEAAYLPDWIFHHLFFGFSELVIYVNNSYDNSWKLKELLTKNTQVRIEDGDNYFQQTKRSPQNLIYEIEMSHAKKQGFSHVMFLDIDEYFTTTCLSAHINDVVAFIDADVCCFEWVLKLKEEKIFSAPFCDALIHHKRARQVKSLVKTDLKIKQFNPHNVYSERANYRLADKTTFKVTSPLSMSLVPAEELLKPLKDYFVLHRILRHEVEYIASLTRGRPIPGSQKNSIFKDNRGGILSDENAETLSIPQDAIENYQRQREIFFQKYTLNSFLEEAQQSVIERYNEAIQKIQNAPIEESDTLKKILRNVTDKGVIDAYNEFKMQHK
ncbi:glycosyltransferase family 2 protein [Glaciecola sp. KUL10]|uniref:glycosyltransferase family 2 protein n=1 Tax=Glaciecola sp. (strain KUL10) TaxID=2161813 RepID=UPI000D78C908|nr:glycosyltransferase family 2 protein [Glaciecola sp. KUL10]GBL04209.1 hypothetical protein KUL10_15150 [Glaciecola sp. KUL10]